MGLLVDIVFTWKFFLLAIVGAVVSWYIANRPKPLLSPIYKIRHHPFIGAMVEISTKFAKEQVWHMYRTFKLSNWKPIGFSMLGFPTSVILIDPEDLVHVLTTNFRNYEKGRIFYDHFLPLLGQGIFSADGDSWMTQRKIASHMFSTSQLRVRMDEVFNEHAAILSKELNAQIAKDESKGSTVVDIQRIANCFTFDSICNIAFGVKVNSLQKNEHHLRFQQAYDICNQLAFRRFFMPSMWWKFQRLFNLGCVAFFCVPHRINCSVSLAPTEIACPTSLLYWLYLVHRCLCSANCKFSPTPTASLTRFVARRPC